MSLLNRFGKTDDLVGYSVISTNSPYDIPYKNEYRKEGRKLVIFNDLNLNDKKD